MKVDVKALDGIAPNGLADGRHIQALHAAISRRSWSDTETAANVIRDQLQRAALPAPATGGEAFWVVELGVEQGVLPSKYWAAIQRGWTSNIHEASQFYTKQAAEEENLSANLNATVSEHAWMSTALPPSPHGGADLKPKEYNLLKLALDNLDGIAVGSDIPSIVIREQIRSALQLEPRDILPDTGHSEADRLIGRLTSDDPDFEDCADAALLIRRLVIEHKGPDGYETWKDAAIAERTRRNNAPHGGAEAWTEEVEIGGAIVRSVAIPIYTSPPQEQEAAPKGEAAAYVDPSDLEWVRRTPGNQSVLIRKERTHSMTTALYTAPPSPKAEPERNAVEAATKALYALYPAQGLEADLDNWYPNCPGKVACDIPWEGLTEVRRSKVCRDAKAVIDAYESAKAEPEQEAVEAGVSVAISFIESLRPKNLRSDWTEYARHRDEAFAQAIQGLLDMPSSELAIRARGHRAPEVK